MKSEKKNTMLGIVGILLLVLGISFAYFTAVVFGEGKQISVNVNELKIVFNDTAAITADGIMPNWSTSKTFTVENQSGENYKYNILMKNFSNTFVTTGFLQYKITSDNNGYSMSGWKDVPKSAEVIDIELAEDVSIAAGVTQTYTIEFRYPNSETINQDDDQGKTFSGILAITVAGPDPRLYDQLLADNPTRLTRDNFASPFNVTNTGTLYEQSGNFTEDVTGDGVSEKVYYFAGDAQNNWVKFGKGRVSTCTYDGNPITFGNLQTLEMKEYGLTESECKISKVCKVTASSGNLSIVGKPVLYATGLSEVYCSDMALGDFLGSGHTYEYINDYATYTSEFKELYWRIIRTNEDGGVRLLYAGTTPSGNDAYIANVPFNGDYTEYDQGIYNDAHAGYMYGTTGSLANHRANTTSSNVKLTLDSWYNEGLNTLTDGTYKYDSYVSKTAIYCNDRSTDAWNLGTSTTYFASFKRINGNQPSYKCGNDETGTLYSTSSIADKFSVSETSGGNGDLTYPIALITADELKYAGAGGIYNPSPWYYVNSLGESITDNLGWYTMSPYYLTSEGEAKIFQVVNGSNNISSTSTPWNDGVRPVISLKSCALTSGGTGTSSNPYKISIDADCVSKEN